MDKETVRFVVRIALSLVVGFLVVYPLWLYGRHFLMSIVRTFFLIR